MCRGISYWQVTMPLCAALAIFTATSRAQELYPTNDETENKIKSVLNIDSFNPTETIEEPYVAVLPNARPSDAIPEIIRERYENRSVKISREVIQDSEGNYINHGPWTMYNESGEIVAEGQYKNNKYHGIWTRTHQKDSADLFSVAPFNQFEGPFSSQATFKEGKINGNWTIFDAKQRKISEWSFANGNRHGNSTWWYADGRISQQISYRDGAIDGSVKRWDTSSKLISNETYQKGRKLATKSTLHQGADQKKTEGVYLHAKIIIKTGDDWWNAKPAVFTTEGKDERHGAWTTWYSNGQIQQQGEFKNDLPVGKMTWWFSNGQKSLEGNYNDGKQQGTWVWWHENGQKKTDGSYSDGSPASTWLWWHNTGKVAQRANFNDAQNHVAEIPSAKSATLPKIEAPEKKTQFKY